MNKVINSFLKRLTQIRFWINKGTLLKKVQVVRPNISVQEEQKVATHISGSQAVLHGLYPLTIA